MRSLLAPLALIAAATATQAAGLGGGDNATGNDLLPAEEAFVLGVERQANSTLLLHWTIAPEYYLYRDRTEIALEGAGDARLGEPKFPAAKTKQDPNFGKVAVFYEEARVRVPIEGQPPPDAQLVVTYQGCNEPIGVCYPPIERSIDFASIEQAAVDGQTAAGNGARGASEQGEIATALGRWSLGWTVLAFVGFGLLLALTPCVFPMLPILAGVVAGERDNTHARRGTGLAVVFVVTMALTYALVGAAVGLTGASIQAWFQHPAVLSATAAVFVVLAAAMFGLFDLQVPGHLRERLEARTRRLGGSITGAAVLGPVSALVVGPCVTPPLIGALLFIAETGDPVTGGLALFALGMGMGVPLIAFGTAAGHLLPRAGNWMKTIQAAFGFLLLAVAVWLVQRIVPVPVAMALWSVLLIVAGIQLGALASTSGAWPRFWQAIGVVFVLYGALLLIGAAAGGASVVQPLRGIAAAEGESSQPQFRAVDDDAALREAVARASASDRTVMLEVYADWCVSCQELEEFTFPDQRVQAALGDTVLLRADVTANDSGDQALLQRFDLYGPPAILFFGPDGVERRSYRVVGFKEPEAFSQHVRRALPEADS